MGRDDQAWAVFWCSLLSPLLLGEVPEAERETYFRTLAEEERLLPNGQRKRISVRTLRRWWKRLRDEGVEGTFRRRRSDRGRPRTKQQPLLERAVELKKEQPRRSDVVINRILMQEFGRVLPRSTLYRHLRREGATRRKLGQSQQKVRCRWTRDQAGALWVGDFEHGPPVLQEGRAVATRLSAWIDCHSRYVVEARYYFRENFDVLVDSLLRAWTQHGASRELYVHAAVHSQTGQPPAERYQEATRFQRTVRLQSVTQLFQRREQRTVHRDHSDVTVEGRYFAVDPQLRGDRLEVRFDPFLTHEEPQEVQLHGRDGKHLGVGRLYQREKGHHPQPPPPAGKQPIEPAYLDALEAGRQASHQQRRQSGLDFQSASSRNVWSLSSFATLIAKLLGRDGGLSALRPDELDALRAFHTRHDRVHESLLRAAVASAESATIPHVLFRLQSLLSPGDT